jgi:hypothetical protein
MENLTQHARTRMQQRGIPQSALECLLDYGRFQYDHRGAAIVFLDKAARRRLTRDLKNNSLPGFSGKTKDTLPRSSGKTKDNSLPRSSGGGLGRGHTWGQLQKHLDAYAVIATDGTITTVGHRYKRIPRP